MEDIRNNKNVMWAIGISEFDDDDLENSIISCVCKKDQNFTYHKDGEEVDCMVTISIEYSDGSSMLFMYWFVPHRVITECISLDVACIETKGVPCETI